MSDYFGFPNMANIPNPSEWKHADTAKDWAEKANNSAVLAKNYAQQIVDSVDVIDEHVHQMDEHITDVTAEVLTAAQTATTKAAQAATSEANASASATSASTSATSAATSATSAADSATAANTYKNTAQSAATDAITAKTAAQTAATTATTKAAEAASSAIDAATAKSYAQQIADSVEEYVDEAETYATNAQTYANAAGTHADEAETSAQLADTKATAATASANAAAASVTQAQQVVSTASSYAAQAQTQATNAATSASAAATSATNAASSADAASISAESASTDAEAASTFADSADSSADAAAASATTAEGHKDNAAASALTAQNFKVQASTFATNAQNSATAAAQSAADAASSASSVNMNEFTEDHTPRYIAETKTLQEGYFILPGAQDGMTSNVVAYDSTQFVRLFKDATAIKQIINAHTFLNEMKITRTAQNTLVCSDPYDNTVTTNWQYNSTKSPENSAYNTTDTYRTVTYTMPTATTSTRTYRLGTTNTARTKTCYCAGELPISGMAADTIYYTVDAAGTTITGRYNTNWTGNESDLQFDYYAKVYYDTLGSAAKLANFKATETINFTGGFEYSYSNGCKFYWTSYSNSGIGRNRKLIDDYAKVNFKSDHRVRVWINLPVIDNSSEWNDSFSGGGYLGANFCPNSTKQYRSILARYIAAVNGDQVGLEASYDLGVNNKFFGINNAYIDSEDEYYSATGRANSIFNINLSDGERIPTKFGDYPICGRLHTGWASYAVPSFNGLGYNNFTSTYNNNGTSSYFLYPFKRTSVPIAPELTEDYVTDLTTVNNLFANSFTSSSSRNPWSQYCHGTTYNMNYKYSQCYSSSDFNARAIRDSLESTNLVGGTYNVHSVIEGTSTVLADNPSMFLYAGYMVKASGTNTTTDKYASRRITNCYNGLPSNLDFSTYRTYNISNSKYTDFDSMASLSTPDDSNPLLPSVCGYSNTFAAPFLTRFGIYSNDTYYFNGMVNDDMNSPFTLGIRYFDAEAQEWRVFSPGDNCSYSYDGSHWGYKRYLWVDLDKPVTYIVGGLSAPSTYNKGTGGYYPGQFDSGSGNAFSPYTKNTYWSFSEPIPAESGVTHTSDLIHVETPNFDNYTSYTYWRGLTMMTVDYSSSPLGPDDTVYCADSCYGIKDSNTGELDLTKVSALYGMDSRAPISLCRNTSGINSNLVLDSNCTTNSNALNYSNATYSDHGYYGLFSNHNNSSITDVRGRSDVKHSIQHTAYHIRIAKLS